MIMGVPAELRGGRDHPPLLPLNLRLRVASRSASSISRRSATRGFSQLRIGVHFSVSDGYNTPPAHALVRRA